MAVFKPEQRERLIAANPEMAAMYRVYNSAQVVSIFFANRVPAPLQTDLYTRTVIGLNESDPEAIDRKAKARVEREGIFDEQGVRRILVMGQAALRTEYVDDNQLRAIMDEITRHRYLIGIIPDDLMPKEDELPANWPSRVLPQDRRNLIVVDQEGGASRTALRDGSLVTPVNTSAGKELNSHLIEVSLQLSSLALVGAQAAELVAGMRH